MTDDHLSEQDVRELLREERARVIEEARRAAREEIESLTGVNRRRALQGLAVLGGGGALLSGLTGTASARNHEDEDKGKDKGKGKDEDDEKGVQRAKIEILAEGTETVNDGEKALTDISTGVSGISRIVMSGARLHSDPEPTLQNSPVSSTRPAQASVPHGQYVLSNAYWDRDAEEWKVHVDVNTGTTNEVTFDWMLLEIEDIDESQQQ